MLGKKKLRQETSLLLRSCAGRAAMISLRWKGSNDLTALEGQQ
jgi:hypothetical protein